MEDRSPDETEETKAQKFKRLGDRRVAAALDHIRLIGNLASPSYEYTNEQVDKIETALTDAVKKTMDRFRGNQEEEKFEL